MGIEKSLAAFDIFHAPCKMLNYTTSLKQ